MNFEVGIQNATILRAYFKDQTGTPLALDPQCDGTVHTAIWPKFDFCQAVSLRLYELVPFREYRPGIGRTLPAALLDHLSESSSATAGRRCDRSRRRDPARTASLRLRLTSQWRAAVPTAAVGQWRLAAGGSRVAAAGSRGGMCGPAR